MAAALELGGEEHLQGLAGDLDAGQALAEGDDVRIVVFARQPRLGHIVREDCANLGIAIGSH